MLTYAILTAFGFHQALYAHLCNAHVISWCTATTNHELVLMAPISGSQGQWRTQCVTPAWGLCLPACYSGDRGPPGEAQGPSWTCECPPWPRQPPAPDLVPRVREPWHRHVPEPRQPHPITSHTTCLALLQNPCGAYQRPRAGFLAPFSGILFQDLRHCSAMKMAPLQ